MGAKVFCFASAKGGSGKTILSATFGSLLAGIGKKCLLIDADAATNGLTLLYLESVLDSRDDSESEDYGGGGVFDAGQGTRITGIGQNLFIFPATYLAHNTQKTSPEDFCSRVERVVSHSRNLDFVIIDAQAGVDAFAIAAMRLADEVVIVSEFDPVSTKGVERMKALVSSELRSEKTWVLLNKVLPEFSTHLSDFLGVVRYLPPVPWSADVVRAYVRGELALDLEEGNVFTIGLLRTAGILFGKEVASLGEKWQKSLDKRMRDPLREQLAEMEAEAEAIEKVRFLALQQARASERLPRRLMALGMVTATTLLAVWQILTLYTNLFVTPEIFDLLQSMVPAGAMILASVLAVYYLARQKHEERKRAELEKFAEDQGRQLRNLQEKRDQLKTHLAATIEETLANRGSSD